MESVNLSLLILRRWTIVAIDARCEHASTTAVTVESGTRIQYGQIAERFVTGILSSRDGYRSRSYVKSRHSREVPRGRILVENFPQPVVINSCAKVLCYRSWLLGCQIGEVGPTGITYWPSICNCKLCSLTFEDSFGPEHGGASETDREHPGILGFFAWLSSLPSSIILQLLREGICDLQINIIVPQSGITKFASLERAVTRCFFLLTVDWGRELCCGLDLFLPCCPVLCLRVR